MPALKHYLLIVLAVSLSSAAHGGEVLPDEIEEAFATIKAMPASIEKGNAIEKAMLGALEEAKKGITFKVTTKPFDPKAHVIKKCGDAVCLIDGKPFYGTGGKMPKQEVTSLVFEWKGRRVALDVSSMYDPGVTNANIQQHVTAYSWGWGDYTVTGYFSKGDARYVCQWRIVKNSSSARSHINSFGELFALDAKLRKDFNYKSLESIMRENSNQKE